MKLSRETLFKLNENHIKKILYDKAITCVAFDTPLSHIERNELFERVIKLNKNNDLNDVLTKQAWSIRHYDKMNLPIIIGNVNERSFGARFQRDKYLWAMDMPIKLPFSQVKVPIEFSQFTDFFKSAIQFERMINPNYDKSYAYVCIDQRPVESRGYQRRPGWHADSFITKYTNSQYNESCSPIMDTVYLAYDCLATEFHKGPFSFPNSVDIHSNDAVLGHFEEIASAAPDSDIVVFPNHTILKMDPRCVHRVQMNETNCTLDRTFIKLTFTTEIFNRLGNDHNKLFDYNWPLLGRGMERNNSSLSNGFFDESKYIFVDNIQLANMFKLIHFDFDFDSDIAEKKIHKIHKTGLVHMQPSYEGELLVTEDTNNIFITHNVAKLGDYKITNINNGTQYFLSGKKVFEFYDVHSILDGIIIPKPIVAHAIQIKKHIKIFAPWNTYQYLCPGDFIVKKNDDVYGIKQNDFQKCYLSE